MMSELIIMIPQRNKEILHGKLYLKQKSNCDYRTDRILWNTAGKGIEQVFYDRIEYRISDHRPVVSYLFAQVKKIDKEKKNNIIKQVYDVK